MKRVSEIEGEPEVGKFYLVPCVTDTWGRQWPVIGPQHNDQEILNVPGEHYHRDIRFCTREQITAMRAAAHWYMQDEPDEYVMTVALFRWVDGVAYKRLKCLRQMPDFPIAIPKIAVDKLGPVVSWFPKLEAAYEDAKLSSCLRCPHRGMPLKGLPEKDGVVVCPGHGLAWDVRTGQMVRRTK